MATYRRTPRRRRDTERPGPTLIGGLLVCLALAGLVYLGLKVYDGIPGREYRTAYVSVPRVGNLIDHDGVRMGGIRIGQVLGRDVGPDGRPRLELQLEKDVELAADTTVRVRALGLLGARYIELVNGTSGERLRDGAVITGKDDTYVSGLPETLEIFDDETRGALATTLGGLGQGFQGNGERANDALRNAGERAKPFSEVARTILRRDGAAGRLLPALESAVRPMDARRSELTDMMGVTADAVRPLAEEREAVREGLRRAPGALAAAQPGLAAASRLARSAQRLTAKANATLPPAPAALRSARALLAESPAPLRRTDALLRAARPALPGLTRIGDALRPVLQPVTELLGELRPTLGEVERFGCDIVNFGVVMRSMTGFTQPGPDGPVGNPQAFRLQVVAPLSTDIVGVKSATPFFKREGLEPCKYLAKPYPQFVPGGRR